jgi:hypothetical protein
MSHSTLLHSNPARQHRLLLWLMTGLLLLAFALGARSLDDDAVWGDEFFSIYDSGGEDESPLTLAQIWERVATRNPWHTPGFFFLLSGWGRLAGWEPFVGRVLALLIGLPALAWTYRLGADVVSRRVGLYAALVLGTLSFYVYYLHELRMYTLIALLTAFTFWCYLRLIRRRQPRRWVWIGFFGGALSLLYLHYFAALPVMALGLYHLLFVPKNRRWWRIVGLLLLAGLLFLPWLSNLGTALELAVEADTLNLRSLDTVEALAELVRVMGNGIAPLVLLAALLGAAGLWVGRKRDLTMTQGRTTQASSLPMGRADHHTGGDGLHRRTTQASSLQDVGVWVRTRQTSSLPMTGGFQIVFLALALVALLLLANAILQVMHEGRLRYFMLLLPPLAIGIGIAVERAGYVQRLLTPLLLTMWIATGLVGVFSGSVTAGLDGSAYTMPLHRIEHELDTIIQPDDYLIAFPPANLPTWRYRVPADFYLKDLGEGYFIPNVLSDSDTEPVNSPDEIVTAAGSRQRLWVAVSPDEQPPTFAPFQQGIDVEYDLCSTVEQSPHLALSLYTRSPVCCVTDPATAEPILQFGDGIALTGYEPIPPIIGSDILRVMLGWRLDASVPPDTYSYGLHIVDGDGRLVDQSDDGVPYQRFACEPATIDLTNLRPGEYTLLLVVYNWQTGAALPATDRRSGATGERLPLATFRVAEG